MDTRTKIVTLEQALEVAGGGRPVSLVTGHFDVLLAAHVRELARVRESLPGGILLVALTAPQQQLLDSRARAEMTAALAMVDYVVSLEDQQLARLLAAIPAERTVRMETAHQHYMRELIQHVRQRSSQ